MEYTGRLKLPGAVGSGAPVELRFDDVFMAIAADAIEVGRWRLDELSLERIVSDEFSLAVGEEEYVFVADDALDLAYEGLEHVAEVRESLGRRRRRRGKKNGSVAEALRTLVEVGSEDLTTAPTVDSPAGSAGSNGHGHAVVEGRPEADVSEGGVGAATTGSPGAGSDGALSGSGNRSEQHTEPHHRPTSFHDAVAEAAPQPATSVAPVWPEPAADQVRPPEWTPPQIVEPESGGSQVAEPEAPVPVTVVEDVAAVSYAAEPEVVFEHLMYVPPNIEVEPSPSDDDHIVPAQSDPGASDAFPPPTPSQAVGSPAARHSGGSESPLQPDESARQTPAPTAPAPAAPLPAPAPAAPPPAPTSTSAPGPGPVSGGDDGPPAAPVRPAARRAEAARSTPPARADVPPAPASPEIRPVTEAEAPGAPSPAAPDDRAGENDRRKEPPAPLVEEPPRTAATTDVDIEPVGLRMPGESIDVGDDLNEAFAQIVAPPADPAPTQTSPTDDRAADSEPAAPDPAGSEPAAPEPVISEPTTSAPAAAEPLERVVEQPEPEPIAPASAGDEVMEPGIDVAGDVTEGGHVARPVDLVVEPEPAEPVAHEPPSDSPTSDTEPIFLEPADEATDFGTVDVAASQAAADPVGSSATGTLEDEEQTQPVPDATGAEAEVPDLVAEVGHVGESGHEMDGEVGGEVTDEVGGEVTDEVEEPPVPRRLSTAVEEEAVPLGDEVFEEWVPIDIDSESAHPDDETFEENGRRRAAHAKKKPGLLSRIGRTKGGHQHEYSQSRTVGGITRRVCATCGNVSFEGEDVYEGW